MLNLRQQLRRGADTCAEIGKQLSTALAKLAVYV
jgi:hypothetical protein